MARVYPLVPLLPSPNPSIMTSTKSKKTVIASEAKQSYSSQGSGSASAGIPSDSTAIPALVAGPPSSSSKSKPKNQKPPAKSQPPTATSQKPTAKSQPPKANAFENATAFNQDLSGWDLEKQKRQTPTVVIPFKASMAKGDELKYALRAWAKHLPGVAIVIIGDKPSWLSKKATHIPIKPQHKNPQIDVAHKMVQAIAAAEVPEYFFWSNDDIYPVCHLTISDIDILKAHGRLQKKGAPGGIYRENSLRTVSALKRAGITMPWDFATHTPVAFHKYELAEVITRFNCLKEGHLVSSLYFNTTFRGHRPILTQNGAEGSIVASVFKSNPDKRILERVFNRKKFINNNDAGWKPVLPYLQKLFPKKSRFER